ncbi:winged helix-turn-helix transcriptional regulator [Natrialba sp. INN-245]|uniref:winged helix-turn-helix transcriptional regulator n=1 Tax=Natrialba sp. INN-245 TaxID=2690967 RepID=UPI0013120243|nr:winged helix-turn-helix transcriptional regulator [Natrialba sp. INN-245]MWV38536.1 HoxA-like transcriptional regulator [Natrialba sp. INN-245]
MTYRDADIPAENHRALEALTLLSKKWSPIILLMLQHHGSKGFNELLEGVPDISSKVLSDTLDTLQEAGLIERRVVSESPLRVEYDLTEAGRDMEPIFESLADWVEEHLETTTRTVLLADGDRRITEMYRQWLSDRYTVVRAHDSKEFYERFDDRIDVVLLDAGLPGIDPRRFVDDAKELCRTALIVGDRPDPELLSVDCDDILRKPFVRETALKTVADQLSRLEESEDQRARTALEAKRSLFESIYSTEQLEEEQAYRDALARLTELERQESE